MLSAFPPTSRKAPADINFIFKGLLFSIGFPWALSQTDVSNKSHNFTTSGVSRYIYTSPDFVLFLCFTISNWNLYRKVVFSDSHWIVSQGDIKPSHKKEIFLSILAVLLIAFYRIFFLCPPNQIVSFTSSYITLQLREAFLSKVACSLSIFWSLDYFLFSS